MLLICIILTSRSDVKKYAYTNKQLHTCMWRARKHKHKHKQTAHAGKRTKF